MVDRTHRSGGCHSHMRNHLLQIQEKEIRKTDIASCCCNIFVLAGDNEISSLLKCLDRILNKDFFQVMCGILKMPVDIIRRGV